MKPVIGVIPLFDDKKDSIWMVPGYMEGIRRAGGIPMMLPLTWEKGDLEQINSMCRGYLFTGGHDVAPKQPLRPCQPSEGSAGNIYFSFGMER